MEIETNICTGAEFNGSSIEQLLELKDGRKIFKTHNGFRSYVQDQKGKVLEVDENYYRKVKHNTKLAPKASKRSKQKIRRYGQAGR